MVNILLNPSQCNYANNKFITTLCMLHGCMWVNVSNYQINNILNNVYQTYRRVQVQLKIKIKRD